MHHNSATKAEESQFHTTNFQQHRSSFVDDVQLIHLVFTGSELFQNAYIFACAPYSVHGNIELQTAVKELWEFGER
jgi:hypothetical protein